MFILLLSRTYLGNGFSSTIHKSCKLTPEENGMLLGEWVQGCIQKFCQGGGGQNWGMEKKGGAEGPT